jgi:hypothetical protein
MYAKADQAHIQPITLLQLHAQRQAGPRARRSRQPRSRRSLLVYLSSRIRPCRRPSIVTLLSAGHSLSFLNHCNEFRPQDEELVEILTGGGSYN